MPFAMSDIFYNLKWNFSQLNMTEGTTLWNFKRTRHCKWIYLDRRRVCPKCSRLLAFCLALNPLRVSSAAAVRVSPELNFRHRKNFIGNCAPRVRLALISGAGNSLRRSKNPEWFCEHL